MSSVEKGRLSPGWLAVNGSPTFRTQGASRKRVNKRHKMLKKFYSRLTHGRKSRGTEDESPPEFAVGDANTGCPPDFCHFSKFQALAMDSSPQISTHDLRHWTNTISSTIETR
jgi:hypothetical protein